MFLHSASVFTTWGVVLVMHCLPQWKAPWWAAWLHLMDRAWNRRWLVSEASSRLCVDVKAAFCRPGKFSETVHWLSVQRGRDPCPAEVTSECTLTSSWLSQGHDQVIRNTASKRVFYTYEMYDWSFHSSAVWQCYYVFSAGIKRQKEV